MLRTVKLKTTKNPNTHRHISVKKKKSLEKYRNNVPKKTFFDYELVYLNKFILFCKKEVRNAFYFISWRR